MPRDFLIEPDRPADPDPRLQALGPRQQEIAQIIYAKTAATPQEIQARLSERRSVRVIRTLLDRLVAKGVIKRRRSGRHSELIYVAAIATESVKQTALKRLVNERFGGSFANAAVLVAAMEQKVPRVPQSLVAARQLANGWVGKAPSGT